MEIIDLHPVDKQTEAQEILGAMFRREMNNCPLQLRLKDGGYIPVETRVWFGQWDGVDCIFDISKDLGKEHEALQKFTKLFENNPALMAITNLEDGKFSDVNVAFLNKLGYSRADVIGRTSRDLGLFVDPARQRQVAEELERVGRIRDLELEVRCRNGETLNGLFSGEIIENKGSKYFLTVMIDFTEQIGLRNRLEAQGRRLRNIIDGTRLATWEWNVQTGETVFDERWAEIAGYTLQELEPVSIATWERLAHPEDLAESEKLLAKHFSGELDYYDSESRMKHKDGHWVWVLDRGKVIEWDNDGKPLRMFGTHLDITEKKEMQEQIREISIRDDLTGVFNRRYVFERIEEIRSEYIRRGRAFCVSVLDLDYFKNVNDRHGHQAGDYVLKEFTTLISTGIRPYDLLGRYGGEEFIIVSLDANRTNTTAMIGRLMTMVRSHVFMFNGKELHCTFSCGIAESTEFTPETVSTEKMVGAADRRLYIAKHDGRDRWVNHD